MAWMAMSNSSSKTSASRIRMRRPACS
uniref:Uncharacterized protein n=1 Tax=Arundo donax TaxID=35708 RepID=A0A0A9BFS6_ARUDO